MAHIYDRWHKSHPREGDQPCKCSRGKNKLFPSSEHLQGKRWQVRWTDHEGKAQKQNFDERGGGQDDTDPDRYAEACLAKVVSDLNADVYVDRAAGEVKFEDYAKQVFAERTLDSRYRHETERRLENHVYPAIGKATLRTLSRRPSAIQSLIAGLKKKKLQKNTQVVILAHVSTVFACALADGKIGKNPVLSSAVTLPEGTRQPVEVWPKQYVAALREELAERYRIVVDLGAGVGMRRGEIFAFGPDDVDWLRGFVHVRRQVKALKGGRVFALPKGERVRTVPLPESVKLALAAHMREFPPIEVTLPWEEVDGAPTTVRLFVSTRAGRLPHTTTFMRDEWVPARERAGIVPPPKAREKRRRQPQHGLHALRHFFASSLLTEGQDIQAVSEWLGHADVRTTWETYIHLLPRNRDRMRDIMDRALALESDEQDGPTNLAALLEAVYGMAASKDPARARLGQELLALAAESTARVPAGRATALEVPS